MENKKCIVGMPVKNDYQSLMWALNSLAFSTRSFDEVVIALSPSDEQTEEYLKSLEDKGALKILRGDYKTPLEAYNKLFEYAIHQEADLLLTQTDVGFPRLYGRDWLAEMRNMADDYSMVTCLNGGGQSDSTYINGFNWVGGWCTFIPFWALQHLEGFDVDFPNGYGVDIDLTYRAINIGKIGIINYWVDHHQMNERLHDKALDSEEMKRQAAIYFRRKWRLAEFKEDEVIEG